MLKKLFYTTFTVAVIVCCIIMMWNTLNTSQCTTTSVSQSVIEAYAPDQQFTLYRYSMPRMRQHGNTELALGSILYDPNVENPEHILAITLFLVNEQRNDNPIYLYVGDIFTSGQYQFQILSITFCSGPHLRGSVTYSIIDIQNTGEPNS